MFKRNQTTWVIAIVVFVVLATDVSLFTLLGLGGLAFVGWRVAPIIRQRWRARGHKRNAQRRPGKELAAEVARLKQENAQLKQENARLAVERDVLQQTLRGGK